MTSSSKQSNYIYSWGFGKYGQLSENNINYSLEPVLVNINIQSDNNKKDNDDWIQKTDIYTGENHSAILYQYETKSEALFFGKNTFGQLGIQNTLYIPNPTRININKKILKISLGGEHSLLLTNERELYTFGLNIFGQLGLGDNNNRNVPTLIVKPNFNNNEYIKDISAGAHHSLLLTDLNNIYSTGAGKYNALGHSILENINIFTLIKNEYFNDNTKIEFIRTGVYHSSCLLSNKEDIYIWGKGNILIYEKITKIHIKDITNETDVLLEDIQIGDDYIIILLNNGNIYSKGKNNKGQLGIGDINNVDNDYIKISFNDTKNKGIVSINLGYEFVIAINEDDEIYGWGSNDYGQLTLKSSTFYTKPQYITSLCNKNPIQLSCGGYHVLSLFEYKLNAVNIIPQNSLDNIYYKEMNEIKLNTTIKNDINPLKPRLAKMKQLDKEIEDLTKKNNDLDEQINRLNYELKKNESYAHKNKNKNKNNIVPKSFINNFEIEEKELTLNYEKHNIGRGTFGEVKKGTYRGQLVAVKYLKQSLQTSKDNLIPFIKECIIMKNLRHPNILLCLGAHTSSPPYFLVTELCENGNLFDFLHQTPEYEISLEERRRIALEICYGMNYLHSFNPPILHRDLKSMNVLLDRYFKIKLADFGTIKSLNIEMTKQKGTFQWMAPEVIKGGKITEKSDVFSFGIIMNEIITRIPPYSGVDKNDVAKMVISNPNYRPDFNPNNTPTEWIKLMTMCYDYNPNKRPTFEKIIEILENMNLNR